MDIGNVKIATTSFAEDSARYMMALQAIIVASREGASSDILEVIAMEALRFKATEE